MAYDPDQHTRRSIRLRGYDYAQPGTYFVTLCVHQKECWLGEIVGMDFVGAHGCAPWSSAMISGLTGDVCMKLSDFGNIVQDEWRRSPFIRPEIELDAFVVMPNHVHGIIILTGDVVGATRWVAPIRRVARTEGEAPPRPYDRNGKMQPGSIGAIIGQFKSMTTKRINIIRGTPSAPVWQRNYYERVIRNEAELHAIRQYIADNPRQWHLDRENPRHR